MANLTPDLNARELGEHLTSGDPRRILDATWAVLNCVDQAQVAALAPLLEGFDQAMAHPELGGALKRNRDYVALARTCIDNARRGLCRCEMLEGSNLFSPLRQQALGAVRVTATEDRIEQYEVLFAVECGGCARRFSVREVHGWHVPWYEWRRV